MSESNNEERSPYEVQEEYMLELDRCYHGLENSSTPEEAEEWKDKLREVSRKRREFNRKQEEIYNSPEAIREQEAKNEEWEERYLDQRTRYIQQLKPFEGALLQLEKLVATQTCNFSRWIEPVLNLNLAIRDQFEHAPFEPFENRSTFGITFWSPLREELFCVSDVLKKVAYDYNDDDYDEDYAYANPMLPVMPVEEIRQHMLQTVGLWLGVCRLPAARTVKQVDESEFVEWSRKELAKHWGVTTRTLQRWGDEGKYDFRPVSLHRIKVNPADVERIHEEQKSKKPRR